MWPFGRKRSTSGLPSPRHGISGAVVSYVVDNRVFLLGLDKLYRDAMKEHERAELLFAARRVAAALQIAPANAPVEGYYSETPELTEYLRLIRALQEVDETRTTEVATLPEFQRLQKVTSAPLYGQPQRSGKLLAVGRDAFSKALLDTSPEWTVDGLTAAAYALARETDDFSLVGVAARLRDPVVLTAVRESAVLYAEAPTCVDARRPQYVWQVDAELAEQARRFIFAFNALFGAELPPPGPNEAERYWHAYNDNHILGRCVRLGSDDTVSPIRHYHWGIFGGAAGALAVQEFWHSEVWTTERYRSALCRGGGRPISPDTGDRNVWIRRGMCPRCEFWQYLFAGDVADHCGVPLVRLEDRDPLELQKALIG